MVIHVNSSLFLVVDGFMGFLDCGETLQQLHLGFLKHGYIAFLALHALQDHLFEQLVLADFFIG